MLTLPVSNSGARIEYQCGERLAQIGHSQRGDVGLCNHHGGVAIGRRGI